MDSSHIKELKALQDEYRRLRQIYAELMLDHQLAKHIIEKSCKALSKARVGGICGTGAISECGRAYRVINLQRSSWYYRSCKDDGPIIDRLSSLAERFPTCGLINTMLLFETMKTNGP